MDLHFNADTRRRDLDAMAAGTADVLVIGGGITGAGIARDAAMRGLSTALVEAGDFGHGTSSRSSRLVHGGLRYLEHGWFRLVFEASRERRILLRIAPHLVWPRAFVFPVHRGSRVRRWEISAGVILYDMLAAFRNVHRHRLLSRRGVLREEPLLRDQDLQGGARYFDAQCDDARLVLANARAAHQHGARLASYARVVGLDKSGGRIRGAVVEDLLGGRRVSVRAHIVVNATGPWTDRFRHFDDPDAVPLLRPTKGVHIVVPQARLGNTGAVTLTSPIDGRVMFVLPWGDMSYIGTTDTDSDEPPDAVAATAEDVTYLLRSANAVFPHARLTTADVIATWAGLRPLLAAPAGSTADVPREHHIVTSETGLITIAGGKLTTFRVMAAQVVDLAAKRLHALDGRPVPARAPTDRVPLPGGELADLEQLVTELSRERLAPDMARHLVHTYGTEAAAVANLAAGEPALAAPLLPGATLLRAEVVHQAQREMALTVEDVLMRRTDVFHHRAGQGAAAADDVAALLAGELGWDAATAAASAAAYRTRVTQMRRAISPE